MILFKRPTSTAPVKVPVATQTPAGSKPTPVPVAGLQTLWGPFNMTRHFFRVRSHRSAERVPTFETDTLLKRLDRLDAENARRVRVNRVAEHEQAMKRLESFDAVRCARELQSLRDLQLPTSLAPVAERLNVAGTRQTSPEQMRQAPVDPYAVARQKEKADAGMTTGQAQGELQQARTILDREEKTMRHLEGDAGHDLGAAHALVQAQQSTHAVVHQAVARAKRVQTDLPADKKGKVLAGGATGILDRADDVEGEIDHEGGEVRSYLRAVEEDEAQADDQHHRQGFGV